MAKGYGFEVSDWLLLGVVGAAVYFIYKASKPILDTEQALGNAATGALNWTSDTGSGIGNAMQDARETLTYGLPDVIQDTTGFYNKWNEFYGNSPSNPVDAFKRNFIYANPLEPAKKNSLFGTISAYIPGRGVFTSSYRNNLLSNAEVRRINQSNVVYGGSAIQVRRISAANSDASVTLTQVPGTSLMIPSNVTINRSSSSSGNSLSSGNSTSTTRGLAAGTYNIGGRRVVVSASRRRGRR